MRNETNNHSGHQTDRNTEVVAVGQRLRVADCGVGASTNEAGGIADREHGFAQKGIGRTGQCNQVPEGFDVLQGQGNRLVARRATIGQGRTKHPLTFLALIVFVFCGFRSGPSNGHRVYNSHKHAECNNDFAKNIRDSIHKKEIDIAINARILSMRQHRADSLWRILKTSPKPQQS